MTKTDTRCSECSNYVTEGETDGLCDVCAFIATQPAHEGHWSPLGGAYWCDTCDSPYCSLI